MKDLCQQFHDAMIDIYLRAKRECKYNAARFIQVVTNKGGVEAARALILKDGGTEGFAKLWELGRLDLSVEALVLRDEYRELFTNNEREACRKRLMDYGYREA
jgi:hypothetical protein